MTPEFINRIDEVIVFRPLGAVEVTCIARKLLAELSHRVLEQDVLLEFSDDAVSLVVTAGYAPAQGARHLARAIDRLVGHRLAEALIQAQVQRGDCLRACIEAGRIVFQPIEQDDERLLR